MSTLQDLFARHCEIQMLISSAVRREETLQSFLDACGESPLQYSMRLVLVNARLKNHGRRELLPR